MSEGIQQLPNTVSLPRKIFNWLPPFLWMAAIYVFSTDTFSAGNTGGLVMKIAHWIVPNLSAEQYQTIHFLIRKLAHFTVYAVLATLLFRSFRAGTEIRWRRQWALYTLFIVAIYALLDEYHQTFTASRTGSIYDSMIDLLGGSFVLVCFWLWELIIQRKKNAAPSAN